MKKSKDNIKISLYNNTKIVIENYNKIIDLNDNIVIIDNYEINGQNLKITNIDEYYIIINGNINNLSIVDDDK
jgi:hypothetical protein